MKTYVHQDAYIVSTGAFLPGPPVTNDEMESILGLVNGRPSPYRRRILKSNGITQRYYALGKNRKATHLTYQLAAESIKKALVNINTDQGTIDMFSVGTTLPDLLAPGIASMVHGCVGGKNADILSCAGICGAGAAAFKAAALSVIAGQHKRVVACGTERPSVIMRGERFHLENKIADDDNTGSSYKYFNAEFLRWMLSDGAGAFIIDNKPNTQGISLKIEWVEFASYAHRLPTCMYMGVSNAENPDTQNTWLNYTDLATADKHGLLLLRQDIKLLDENIADIVTGFCSLLKDNGFFEENNIDWFLPHISSFFFYQRLHDRLVQAGIDIPLEKWFTNLKTKGNTGAASIYIMLDELFYSGRLNVGEKIMLMVPESGRFSVSYALLTVVNNH